MDKFNYSIFSIALILLCSCSFQREKDLRNEIESNTKKLDSMELEKKELEEQIHLDSLTKTKSATEK